MRFIFKIASLLLFTLSFFCWGNLSNLKKENEEPDCFIEITKIERELIYIDIKDMDCSISLLLDSADIDNDGKMDYIWYDCRESLLIFKLSTFPFEPIERHFSFLEQNPDCYTVITGVDGGFQLHIVQPLSSEYYEYSYLPRGKNFRLTGYSHIHSEYGEMSVDLKDWKFHGDWSCIYMYENQIIKDRLNVSLPFDYFLIYFDEERPDFKMSGYELLNAYENAYVKPVSVDTVRFVAISCSEFHDHPSFEGIGSDGKQYVGMGYATFNRDDVVKVSESLACYQEFGDKDLISVSVWTDFEIIEYGKLSLFYEENRKPINYHNHTDYREEIDLVRDPKGFDYYLAISDDETLNHYRNEPGSFEVHLHEYIYEGEVVPKHAYYSANDCHWYLVDLFNEYNGKQEKIDRLVMEVTHFNQAFFYSYDEENGEIKLIELD